MKFNEAQSGFSILIVLFVTSIVLIYYLNLQRSSEFMLEAWQKRYQFEKHFRLTEALYFYGLTYCMNNYDEILLGSKNNKEKILYNGQWIEKNSLGTIKVFVKKPDIFLEVLLKKDQSTYLIKATLNKQEFINPIDNKTLMKKFSVLDWQINAV